MDIRQLQYFIAAAKSESFSKAAERLNISQSALGSQIRNLEQELAAELFERHARGTELTPNGRILLSHAEEIVSKVRSARDAMTASQRHMENNIAIGMTSTVSSVLAAPLLNRIGQKHPELKLTVFEEKSTVLIEKVASREFMLALCFNSHHISGVRWEPALEEHVYFVESAALGKANGGEITLCEVLRHRLALPALPATMRSIVERAAAAENLELNVLYNVGSSSLMRTLVGQRAAASIMPYAMVSDLVSSGEFIAKRITPSIYRELYFLTSDRCTMARGTNIVKRELQLLMRDEERQRGAGWQPLQDREGAANRAYLAETLIPFAQASSAQALAAARA